jgi:hypothetical protein
MATMVKPITTPRGYSSGWRNRFGVLVVIIGFLIFLLGARPSLFGLDRSPIVGFVQIATFEVGLGIMCLGGYLAMVSLWGSEQRSIRADIGVRFIATGYVITLFAGMADVFGFGSHPLPGVPYFGPLQALGVEIGEGVIAFGLLLLIPIVSRIKGQTRPRVPLGKKAIGRPLGDK